MNITSFWYFVMLAVSMVLYYGIGHFAKAAQKYILMAVSVFFYLSVSAGPAWRTMALLLYIWLVTYIGALAIEKYRNRVAVFVPIFLLVATLFVLKYLFNISGLVLDIFHNYADISFLNFAPFIGLSYFTLSAIGYLVDVNWQTVRATKNAGEVLLFVLFFPIVISGPVYRFGEMSSQFDRCHELNFDNVSLGIRRMLFGYFKKLVISERFALVTERIFAHYNDYSGIVILVGAACYMVELYTDFSGCMDIIMGSAKLFGIELPENFNAPFFAGSIREFWQRWHITLGAWFKDYVMYPVQKSKPFVKLSKSLKKKFGKTTGKKIPMYLAMLVLWSLIGIWHGGTLFYFVASAAIPFTYLIISDLCQPLFAKMVKALRINTQSFGYRIFAALRTMLLLCMIWLVVCSGSLSGFGAVMKRMFTVFLPFGTKALSLYDCGLDRIGFVLMVIGFVVLIVENAMSYKGSDIFHIYRPNFAGRTFMVVAIYVEVLLLMIYGLVGQSAFIYFNF